MSDTILCPKCKCEIEVTEVLSSQLRAELQKQFDAEQRARDAEFAKREVEIKRLQQAVAVEKSAIDDEVAFITRHGNCAQGTPCIGRPLPSK